MYGVACLFFTHGWGQWALMLAVPDDDVRARGIFHRNGHARVRMCTASAASNWPISPIALGSMYMLPVKLIFLNRYDVAVKHGQSPTKVESFTKLIIDVLRSTHFGSGHEASLGLATLLLSISCKS